MSVAGGNGGSALRCGSITRGRAVGAGTRGTTVIGGASGSGDKIEGTYASGLFCGAI